MAFTALHDLYINLLSKDETEMITTEESKYLSSRYFKAFGTCLCLSAAGGILTFSAARKLTKLKALGQVSLSFGAYSMVAASTVGLITEKVANSSLDHILGQDGTRMQKELMNILVRNNQGEPWGWKLMSKYFFPEPVYNDEVDKPQMYWRRRTTSIDFVLSSHDMNEAKPQSSRNSTPSSPNGRIPRESHVSLTKPKHKNNSGNSDNEIAEDPFHCLFGVVETTKKVHSSDNPSGLNKTQARKQRRAQRRQRLKNLETSGNSPQYEHM